MNQKLSATQSRPPSSAPALPARAKRGRILLLEDDKDTRIVLARLFEARDFDVRAAATVAEAWELSSDGPYDLLVSDIGLPDGDGYRLMRELQDLHGLQGIALTGYGLDDDIALSREAGFADHLVKPIQIDLLDQALNRLCPRKAAAG
jgi:DNA-binding response OmpR family regulator